MFKALNITSNEHVISISQEWVGKGDLIDTLVKENSLCCPSCKESLWFRNGIINRPHFAHRKTADCPLNSKKSTEELEAQVLFYELLEAKSDEEVTVDFLFEGEKHAVDILLGSEGGYRRAYYFLSKNRRNLHDLLNPAISRGIPIQIIYTESLHKSDDHFLKLTKQQLDNTEHSKRYDPNRKPNYGHLYFLNTVDAVFHIYRGIKASWGCSQHSSYSRQHLPISELKVDEVGELFTDEDVTTLELRALKEAKAAPKRTLLPKKEYQTDDNIDEKIYPWEDDDDSSDKLNKLERKYTPLRGVVSLPKTVFKCEDCGIVTSDWSVVRPKLQTCVCNKCTTRRHTRGDVKDDFDW